jgi:hypothetical protein
MVLGFGRWQNEVQLCTKRKNKIWKLKEADKEENFQELLRTKLPKDKTQLVEEECDRF